MVALRPARFWRISQLSAARSPTKTIVILPFGVPPRTHPPWPQKIGLGLVDACVS